MAIAVIMMAAVLLFRGLIFTDRILGRGDPFTYFGPYWQLRADAFREGRLPLWTPDVFMGAPVLANSQVGVLYPANWLVTGLDAHVAIKWSLIAHALWAGVGVWALARVAARASFAGAALAGILFIGGGYLGSQTEHINQFQALAWMPWLFVLLHLNAGAASTEHRRLSGLLLSAGFAMQVLAGHTQTVVITGVGLGIYALCLPRRWTALGTLALASIGALLLTTAQLIPTLELSGQSMRAGGLPVESALAFSLSPFVAGRALLPSYDALLFPEYVAYVGVLGLGAAALGSCRRVPERTRWLALAVIGLALALGAYNPLNWLLAQFPPFDLFRVPARWLALTVLAASMLAALGLDHIRAARRWQLGAAILVVLIAAASSALTTRADDPSMPAATSITLIGWAAGLITLGLIFAAVRRGAPPGTLPALALVELLIASAWLPYSVLVTPDIATDRRLTAHQIAVFNEGIDPPPRILSMSALEWDPYDLNAIRARYAALGAGDAALHAALTGVKLNEMLSPNLSAAWGLPTVDGYDGGLLPTRAWYAFVSHFAPPEAPPLDGRLREALASEACGAGCVPPLDLLETMGVGYLIMDKTHDLFVDDIAYDVSLPVTGFSSYASQQNFVATEARLLITCREPCEQPLVLVDDEELPAVEPSFSPPYQVLIVPFNGALSDIDLTIRTQSDTTLHAVTFVDARTGEFEQLAPDPFARVLSSDIKLYAVNDPARAVLADAADEQAVGGEVDFVDYAPERVELWVDAPEASTLVLRDAMYPGWTATVNGRDGSVAPADGFFRGVDVPAGESTVVFRFTPWWMPGVFVVSGGAWLVWLAALVWTARQIRMAA
jgi:hypothetical protein